MSTYTIKKGNDNNVYMDNKLLFETSTSTLNLGLLHHVYAQIKQPVFEFLGVLPVTDALAIGDSVVSPLLQFGPNEYYIYKYNQGLVASVDKLNNLEDLLTNYVTKDRSVTVDYGVFCFRDIAPVKRYSKLHSQQQSQLSQIIGYSNDEVYDFPFNAKTNVVTCEPFENIMDVFDTKDTNKIVLIYTDNDFGDGLFDVYSNKTLVMQLGPLYNDLITDILNVAEDRKDVIDLVSNNNNA
jgi:hypothetical protein